ncbi:MAG: DUF3299 domain-containing protein [Planctomycetota bacterium]
MSDAPGSPRWPLWIGICALIGFLGSAFAEGCPWCILPGDQGQSNAVVVADDAGELFVQPTPEGADGVVTDGAGASTDPNTDPNTGDVGAGTGVGYAEEPLLGKATGIQEKPVEEQTRSGGHLTPEQKANATAESLYAPAARSEGKYLSVTWEKLASFNYQMPEGTVTPESLAKREKGPYPKDVKKLDKTTVVVSGYMVPVDVKGEKVLTFYLVRVPFGCCYGQPPAMNEYIYVRMRQGKHAEYRMHTPVTTYGTIVVEEEVDKGAILSLYQMDCDDCAAPLEIK